MINNIVKKQLWRGTCNDVREMNGKPCDICTHEHHTQGQGSSPVECVHIRENDERRSHSCDIIKYRMTQGNVFYCFAVIKLAHAP